MQNFILLRRLCQIRKIDVTNYSAQAKFRYEKFDHYALLKSEGCFEKKIFEALKIGRA